MVSCSSLGQIFTGSSLHSAIMKVSIHCLGISIVIPDSCGKRNKKLSQSLIDGGPSFIIGAQKSTEATVDVSTEDVRISMSEKTLCGLKGSSTQNVRIALGHRALPPKTIWRWT